MSLEVAAAKEGVGLIKGRMDSMQTTERRTNSMQIRSLSTLTL